MSWGSSSAEELVLSLSADIWLNGNREGRRWFAQMFRTSHMIPRTLSSLRGRKWSRFYKTWTWGPVWHLHNILEQKEIPSRALPGCAGSQRLPWDAGLGQAGKFHFCLTANEIFVQLLFWSGKVLVSRTSCCEQMWLCVVEATEQINHCSKFGEQGVTIPCLPSPPSPVSRVCFIPPVAHPWFSLLEFLQWPFHWQSSEQISLSGIWESHYHFSSK